MNSEIRQYFQSRIASKQGCWIWDGSLSRGQRGQMQWKGLRKSAPIWAYELYRGSIPDGLLVCHRCDNPACVNPDHLFLGTQSENIRDAVQKGRWVQAGKHFKENPPKGEKHARHKLTDLEVRRIREDPRTGRLIAEDFGITQSYVSKLKRHDYRKLFGSA